MKNHRIWPLVIEDIENKEEWLKLQREEIQAVTFYVSMNDALYQRPVVDTEAFVDESAILIGGMIVKKGCYIGPYAVIRLDEVDIHDPLIIGENSNIQDCAVVHSTTTKIGSRVIVAHQAVVHGAVLEDDVTVYIQATVDGNGTVIGKGSFLHQGSYVGKGVNVPENSYVAPGQKVMCQEQADALPPVPESLKRIHENVMAHNREHCVNHLALKHLNQ